METAGDDGDLLAFHGIYQTVRFVDSAGPTALKIELQGLWFAHVFA
jgi:hypothetical protein